jgi:hypothetical protein
MEFQRLPNLPLSSFELACATNVGTFLLTGMTTSTFKFLDGPLDVDADGFGVFARALNHFGWEADVFVGVQLSLSMSRGLLMGLVLLVREPSGTSSPLQSVLA